MESIGDLLREARNSKKVMLEEASRATKIKIERTAAKMGRSTKKREMFTAAPLRCAGLRARR